MVWKVSCFVLLFGCSFVCQAWHSAHAEDAPLHARIDQLIEGAAGGELAPQTRDGEFLRRVYLDLAGRIPTRDEAAAFFADQDKDKRSKVIDQLLASDDHVRRLQQVLHVMLMERLGDHEEWKKFLAESVKVNKHWDQLVRELLNPNADDEQTRGSALFFSKRLETNGQVPVDVPALVRDVGRLFMGIDVQCAQCHDHLFVDEYKQEHYHGLFAYISQVGLRTDVKFPAVAEKPLLKKVEFMSVFVQEPKSIGPQVPGLQEVSLPTFEKGEEYEVKPDLKAKTPGKPKFSALQALAEQLPTTSNPFFKQNIANRMWWLLMGRGQVHPLDLMHKDNPASHPAVLSLLADELAAKDFDLRWLLKELALTKTYQRSTVASFAADDIPLQSYRVALEKPLLSEQLLQSMLTATGMSATVKEAKQLADLQAKFDKAFALPAREPEVEHAPSVKAALFLLNDTTVIGWLKPQEDNLTARLEKLTDAGALADELYLSVLTRQPTADEKKIVADYLAKHADARTESIRTLAWSLLASNEFGINH
ncbi:hypothetical protein ETAA8_63630 [Anatilimnocola aggregata]|uniref:DUF1549 domain-containing protein n=1 Tax=Anatilimnocola aggregata TaxID=2528021 RepID=A0A517YLW8_9BACT|nr:DUF1549 domain-containing protein [Anatilimnocola aggregata]QDU31210.1 hypothetical protein ETAA8_63630 [Anatilimnocola aggregata]